MFFRITNNIRNHPLRQEFVEESDGMLALLLFLGEDRIVTLDDGSGHRLYRIPKIQSIPHYSEWDNISIGQRICNLFWNRFDGATTCQELNRAKVATMKCLYYMDIHRHYAVPI